MEEHETVLLRFRVGRVATWLTLCCALVCAGLLLLQDDDFEIIGIVGAIYFAFHALLWASMLFPQNGLELNRESLTLRMGFRTATYRWIEVERFHLAGFGPLRAIYIDVSKTVRSRGLFQAQHRLQTGFDDSLPNVFEIVPGDLLALLLDWHSHFGGAKGQALGLVQTHPGGQA